MKRKAYVKKSFSHEKRARRCACIYVHQYRHLSIYMLGARTPYCGRDVSDDRDEIGKGSARTRALLHSEV